VNVTLVWSVQNAFGRSWKLSSHWTKNVRNFFGSVTSKVLGSRTLVRDEDSDERKDHASLSIAMERLLKMTRPASSGLGMPSMGSSPPSSGFGSSGSSGPSSPAWSSPRSSPRSSTKAPGGRRLAGEEALRVEKPWNWETELGERLRLVRALKAAARRVSDAEGSGLFARASLDCSRHRWL